MNKLRSISAAPRHRPVFDFATPLTRKGGELATADDASVPRFVDLGLTQPVFTVLVELCTSGRQNDSPSLKKISQKNLYFLPEVCISCLGLYPIYRVFFSSNSATRRIKSMLKTTLTRFTLPLLLLFCNSAENSIAQKSPAGPTGTLEKMIIANGTIAMNVDLNGGTESQKSEPLRLPP